MKTYFLNKFLGGKEMRWYECVGLLTYTMTKIIPKKKNRWVFGAWFGASVSDNTKAISDYIEKNHPEIEMIWITNEPDKLMLSHGRAFKRNSLQSLPYIITSEVALMNQGYGDLNAINFLGGCFRVQLWHGVAWKKIFKDAMKTPKTLCEKIDRKLFDYLNAYDMYISPSRKQSNVMHTAFGIDDSKILLCGQARNAVLFSEEFRKQAREKLFSKIGTTGKKMIVYMPTFRDNKEDIFSFGETQYIGKLEYLENKYNFVLIEKSHFAAQKKATKAYNSNEIIHYMPTERAEVLLAAADILITDYSSCFFDFLITDRPIIHYIYDYDYYIKDDRGVYYNREEVVCGDCPETQEELWDAIILNLEKPEKNIELRARRREEYITYERPDSCKIVCEEILKRV